MKLVQLLCVVLGVCWFVAWVRHDYPFPLRAALPFMAGGDRPAVYDVVQLVLLVWTGVAARRLGRR